MQSEWTPSEDQGVAPEIESIRGQLVNERSDTELLHRVPQNTSAAGTPLEGLLGTGSWPFQAGNLSAGQSPRSPEDLVISHL